MEYSKKHLDAFLDRVQQYEQAILDIEKNGTSADLECEWWLGPDGVMWDCRVCETTDCGAGNCSGCVIGRPIAPADACDCCCFGENKKTRYAALNSSSLKFVEALKARLAWMLKQSESNGIILVPAKRRSR